MSGRAVIPIENESGELMAYTGRSIDGSEPKDTLPAGFKRVKCYTIWLAHWKRIPGVPWFSLKVSSIALKVVQAEHVCVALIGCALSTDQEAQLVAHFRHVVVMLDGDDAGRRGTGEIAARLAQKVWVRALDLPLGKQPDQLATGEIRELLQGL